VTDENRPASGSKGDPKRGRNEGSGRSSTLNHPSATVNTSRRTPANTSNINTKDSGNKKIVLDIQSLLYTDPSRTSGPVRVKKLPNAVSAAAKKNISIVKEESEDASGQVKKFFEFLFFFFLNHKYKMHIIHQYPTGSTRIFKYTIRFHCKSK